MLDLIFRWICFISIAVAAIAGPWFFGAWEMWWFWPFVAILCVGCVSLGCRIATGGCRGNKGAFIVLTSAIPFLLYAFVWWGLVNVFMSAERAVLLHVTGLLVGVLVVFGMNSMQRRLLFWLLFVNLIVLGTYGVVNQLFWDSTHVLWVPRFPQYAGRAMGSYFCPDHFAGVMEILLCMGLAVLSGRGISAVWKWIAVVASGVAIGGVILSHSRGGLLTLGVIFVFAVVWCFAQYPKSLRWYFRMVVIPLALMSLIGMFYFGGEHIDRFASYGGRWGKAGRDKVASKKLESGDRMAKVDAVWNSLRCTCRGRMYGGATRAWLSAPWFGIGPGMHQNLWPHFAATYDGDRENGIWPTLVNDDIHSYEVHNDWLQLLEEYGVVGTLLFLIPFSVICFAFGMGIKCAGKLSLKGDMWSGNEMRFVYLLSGALALVAMTFHSFGDFNLQMPATVWVLAVVLALGIGEKLED